MGGAGKALDNAHQLELNEYKQRIAARCRRPSQTCSVRYNGKQRDEADKHNGHLQQRPSRLKAELAQLTARRVDEEAQADSDRMLAELESRP